MIIILVVVFLLLVVAINIALWKYGFVHDAVRPEKVLDLPMMDKKERRAIMKRLDRWREEGKLTREQYEVFMELCRSEWEAAHASHFSKAE